MEFRGERSDSLAFGSAVKIKVPDIVVICFAAVGIDYNPSAAVMFRHSVPCRPKIKNLIS